MTDRDAPRTQPSTEKPPTTRLLIVDPTGETITPRMAPNMRVFIDGVLAHADRITGAFYFTKVERPYSVTVRFETSNRKEVLLFNWIDLTSPSPRVTVRNEVVARRSVNASIRLVDEHGQPYALRPDRRLFFALGDPFVEIAHFNRSNWRPDKEGVIHLSALSYRAIAHLQAPIHVVEFGEASDAPNVPDWIFAIGRSEGSSDDLVQTVVMKSVESQTLVLPRVHLPEGATASAFNVMLRPPKLGLTRVEESFRSSIPGMIAIAPPESGLLTTLVAEATLPGGGLGRVWESNIDPSLLAETKIDFRMPDELTLVAPLDHAMVSGRSETFEWNPSPIPNTIYKLTASCMGDSDRHLHLETFTTSTRAPINEGASYDCEWRVQTMNPAMTLDQLATTDGWQARQFEENKLDSGSTSISATRHTKRESR